MFPLRESVVSAKFHWHQYNTKCDADTRKALYANVVSSSGTAMFQGTGERMTKDLTALAPFTMKFMVVAPLE